MAVVGGSASEDPRDQEGAPPGGKIASRAYWPGTHGAGKGRLSAFQFWEDWEDYCYLNR